MPTCISWHSSLSHLGHAIGLSHASETCQSLPVVSSICFGEESVVLPGQPSGGILSPHCLRSLLWWAYKVASFQDFWLIGRSCRIFCGWVEDTLLQIGFHESSTCKSFLKTSPPPFGWRSSTSRFLPKEQLRVISGLGLTDSSSAPLWAPEPGCSFGKACFYFSWAGLVTLFAPGYLLFWCNYYTKSSGLFPGRRRNILLTSLPPF